MRSLIGKPLSYMQDQDIYQWDGRLSLPLDIPKRIMLTDSETYLTPSHSLRPSTSSRAATSTSRRTQVIALSHISSSSKSRKTSSLAIFPRCHLNTLSCGASIRSSAACQNLEPLCSQRERR